MADLADVFGGAFDANSVPEREGFEKLPAGDYIVQIIESDLEDFDTPTRGKGTALKLTFEIIDGPFTGRKHWENPNIRHENPEWQGYGQRALADILRATGTPPTRNSEDFHWKPMIVTMGFQKKDPERNAIKRYKPMAGAGQARQAAPARVAPAAAAAASGSGKAAPWPRRTA